MAEKRVLSGAMILEASCRNGANYHKYWDRQLWADRVDPDQMLQYVHRRLVQSLGLVFDKELKSPII